MVKGTISWSLFDPWYSPLLEIRGLRLASHISVVFFAAKLLLASRHLSKVATAGREHCSAK